jgi:hypothetical protein
MNLITANLWDCQGVLCITTNGYRKKNGEAVMGAGVAKQATQRIPGIAKSLGDRLERNGNRVVRIAGPDMEPHFDRHVLAFPVKYNWRDKANLDLIAKSADQLSLMMDFFVPEGQSVYLPKPGCGNGGLNWSDVSDILEQYLGTHENLYIVDR